MPRNSRIKPRLEQSENGDGLYNRRKRRQLVAVFGDYSRQCERAFRQHLCSIEESKNIYLEAKVRSPWKYIVIDRFLSKTFSFTYKKLSYRTETARQLPTTREGGLDPPVHSTSSGYTYAYGRIRKPQRTYVKRAVRKAHFKLNRGFKVIQGHPYWCRQESEWSVVIMCN